MSKTTLITEPVREALPRVGGEPNPLVSPKLRPWHVERLAIVYVRQSSPQQVFHNRESTARQYALVDRAVALGWPRDRIEVIDEDQGITGSTLEPRFGFQRLMTEVGLDHVGLILGLEVSKLARSCKDWYQLLELCGIFGTLLGDQDGLYDPIEFNDRLVLGLKGTMSHWYTIGWVRGRKLPGLRGRLILWADEKELDRLRQLRTTRRRWSDCPYPQELTTPNPPPIG